MDQLTREWSTFFERCLQHRMQANVFDELALQLHSRSPLPGSKLAGLLLKPREPAAASIDPRVIVYCERLLALKKISAPDVLSATFQYSKDRLPRVEEGQSVSKDDPSKWLNPAELEEVIFDRLHRMFATGERPITDNERIATVSIVTRWMSAMVTSHTSDSMIQAMVEGVQQHPQQSSINVREGLGMLIVNLIENNKTLQLLDKDHAKDVRKALARSLSSFIPFLSQTSLQLANRLELIQKEHDLYDKSLNHINAEAGGSAGLEVAALQLDAVIDLPVLNTRAGLYVFLNSLLIARPLTDDFTILNYLHARYKNDAQNMASDLITAAFDILANAMYRSESTQTMFSLKSFLVNRIPVLLIQLSGSIFPMTAEMCITQALSHIDPNAFPAFSQGFDDIMGGNNSLSDVRQDFLNACALHGLIATNTIERLLGEAPMQGPPSAKHVKRELLSQFKENSDSVQMYVDELTALDGNAGAIVGAVTEYISHLCETQMTMYLKSLCNSLSKKPQALDVILQFTSPASILRPLCQFLDEWRYEETQGEYQPVYDEFGSILLLVLAFVHRYGLDYHDLGISHESFVAQLLTRGHRSIPQEQLTEEHGKQLGTWLKGLYDSDKEALGNDVFASSRPQDFYLIVPTLFSQTVLACSAEVLSLDTVKGGLEYLQDAFLLPSLVGGLTWMASHALNQGSRDVEVLLQIFNKLIRSAPTSADAQAIHSTIISLVSSRLEKCFQTLKRRYPNRNNIEPLLQAIRNHPSYERSVYPSVSEVEKWTSAPPNTFHAALRQTVQQLSQWAAAGALQLNPPGYTHRLIYASLKLLGVYRTLRAILEETKAQTEAGNGGAAVDIAASIICAPTLDNTVLTNHMNPPTSVRTRMNLREMLKAEFDNAASLVATDPLLAETIVRLHRRVEAQVIAVSQAGIPPSQMDIPSVDIVGVQTQNAELDKALNDAAAASMAAAGGDLQADQQALQRSIDQHLDLTAAGGGLNLSGMGVGSAGTADMGADMGNLPDLDMGDMNMGIDLGEDEDAWGLDFSNM